MSEVKLVRTECVDQVLVIWIDNPPINAGSLGVRQGVLDAVAQLQADPALQAAVLIGAGKTFVAGSDLREFGQPLQEPQLPVVIAAIEGCSKPVVAALHGAALGGGLELSLACDARVAAPGTRLGLPEITLGMIPGAGGTQRVPRRTGLLKGLELVCSGERITAEQAHDLHLVEQVVQGDLLQGAVAFAKGMQGRKQRIRDEAVAPVDTAAWDALAQQLLRKGKNRPNVAAAIEAVRWCAELPIDEALAKERTVFQNLRLGRDAFALRHQFFAERQTTKLPATLDVPALPFAHIAIIGAGTMGTGIAISALDAGLRVLLLEQDHAALERGLQRVRDFYDQRVTAQKLSADKAQARKAALQGSLAWEDLAAVDVVIEAVFEDLQVKQQVFARIDQHARPGAVLATNTSYLDIDAIANATARPQDVIGLHFFSPANVMKLLEVVKAASSTPQAIATAMALGKKLGKLPVLCGNGFGFIGNRIYNAYRKQVEFMLEDGALPEQVDAALQKFGFAMGPFAVADLSGLDIAWRMRKSQAATRDPQERYVSILDALCEQGRLGRKTGAGYYSYAEGKKSAAVDSSVQAVIEQASAARGLPRRTLSDEEIVRRALMAMCNEAALLLAEGVARQPSDIDVALVQGYGFPRWEGGPLFWLSQLDAATQASMQQELAEHVGHGFVKGDLHLLSI
ncbi:MAG: enoyl-CoA hydratase/isomerase family protein [Comamonas sp.]|nr:enoyl-CoA hydratase/isomerase family protein [Comamonas sp.]